MDRAAFSLAPAGNPPALGPAWLGGGLFLADVTDVKDPDGRGRVKVRVHGVVQQDEDAELWAVLVTPFAGKDRGAWWVPDVGDLVAVGFVQGDPRMPAVLGGLWHGNAQPPESMDGSGNNNLKVLRTRNGVKLTMDDQDGQEKLVVETPGGQKLTLKDGPGSCELVDANGNSIKLEPSGITVAVPTSCRRRAKTGSALM